MSEINKNKLDEFFSESMEHFSGVPSDSVWEGISDRLDEDEDRPIFWWRRYLLMALPVIAVSLLAVYFLGSGDNIPRANEQNITQNLIKLPEVIDNKSKNQNPEITNSQLEDQAININSSTAQNSKTINSNITTYKPSLPNSTLDNSSQQNSARVNSKPKPNQNSSTNNHLFASDNAIEINQQISNVTQAIKSQTEHQPKDLVIESGDKSNTDESKTDLANEDNDVNETLSFPFLGLDLGLDYERSLESPTVIILKKHPYSKYRIGFSGRFANTFVSDNDMFNGTESYGIRQEYNITEKMAITNAIHLNIQHYDISSNENTIEPIIVQRYTSRSFDDSGGVQKIESISEFIDFSLGLKYSLGTRLFGYRTFINPSFVGQIYLPQTFSFLDLQSNIQVRENKSIIMYLGSANLNFGIEKQLNKKLHLQVSLWAEQSFIPIGLQREKIKSLGISTTLLFGK